MKKLSYILFIYIVLLGIFSSSAFAQPATLPSQNITGCPPGQTLDLNKRCVDLGTHYKLLAPITTSESEGTGSTYDIGGKNPIGKYLNTMIKIFIGLASVLAMMMIVIGGIEYMSSELISSKEAGKSRMTNAVLGLILALGAYAILFTINPDILRTDFEISEATVEIALNDSVPQTVTNGRYNNGVAVGTPWAGIATPLPQNVSLNATQCTSVGQTNCTSTFGLDMSKVIAIQNGCRCPLVITGGTEWWLHGGKTGSTNHQSGNQTVDLRRTPELDAYLSGGKPLQVGGRYQSPVGSVLFEGNHWHIGN